MAAAHGLGVLRAGEVTPGNMVMLWRERLPANRISVIGGKAGLGKSTLATTVAAELSRVGLNVLISNPEDDLAVTRARLDVAGADVSRVHLIPDASMPQLPRDLAVLEQTVREVQAACLVLDPIAGHFRPERRVHDRPSLMALDAIARRQRCAIVGVHHTVKSVQGTALEMIGGPTGGLAGVARAVYLYGFDPDDEDRRALACAKINGVDELPALLFEHETVEYRSGGRVIEAGLLRVVGESGARARGVMSRGRARADRDAAACEWLTVFLAGGEDFARRSSEVRREAGAAGLGWQTLLRARATMQVERVRVGWGGDGFWLWRLPDEHPFRQPPAETAA